MSWILISIDSVVFFIMLLSVSYLLIFAFYSMRKISHHHPKAKKQHRIVVLFPAYNEDRVIVSSVSEFTKQDYPKDKFDIMVISDHMTEETNRLLAELPIKLLVATYDNSSKAKALNLAVNTIEASGEKYDILVILDADNTTEPDFLSNINDAYADGITAIQAHRRAKNLNTDTAILDAVSEEINNSIFRRGHVNMGFSSALIGSGMAFDYEWFNTNIRKVSSVGEDRELELLLLKQGVYIGYLNDVPVYDEKTQKESSFYNQRRRWLAAQLETLKVAIKDFPAALADRNHDYCDKIIQWMMVPRVVVLGVICVFIAITLIINWIYALKWIVLLFLLLLAFSFAVPDYLVTKQFYRAMRKVPLFGVMMVVNMLRLKGATKKFIHTDHSA